MDLNKFKVYRACEMDRLSYSESKGFHHIKGFKWKLYKKRAPIRKSKIDIPESRIQQSFFEWLSHYPKIRPYCFAIPNGGSRHKLEAYNLKRQGVTKGVPDVFLAIPKYYSDYGPEVEHHGLFIEFKSKKGKLSTEQDSMIKRLKDNGYRCVVCRSLEEAKEAVIDYIGNENMGLKMI